MNYADIKYPDIQDGTGIRLAIYVSGCHFHCKNCHNKIAWDPNYGKEFTDDTINYIIDKFAENRDYNEGLSLLGGEPLEPYNQEGLLKLTTIFREKYPEKNIWCWTGFDFDKDIINKMYVESEITKKLLNNIDIIVDGTFIEDKKMIDLIARGSYNQRKIDVQASIKEGKTIYLEFGDEERFKNKVLKPKMIKIEEYRNDNINIEENNDDKVGVLVQNLVKDMYEESPKFEINPLEEKISATNKDDNNVHNL